jgi:hypothetical protein
VEGSLIRTFPIPDPVTPEWLTAVLGPSGILGQATVRALEHEPTGAFNSATIRLHVRYAADAPADAPTHLILKRNIAQEWAREAGAEEVRFYALIASLADHPRITAPCYAAAYDEDSGQSYLLLRDLSATHRPPITRDQQVGLVDGVPPAAHIAAVVETLARLHAYWWDHPLLEAGPFPVGYWSRTRERFEQYLRRRTASWQRVDAREGAWLPADVRALYERVLAHLPAYWEQDLQPRFQTTQTARHLTLTHGDAYFANFLCPEPPTSGPTYLLDWQSPGVDIGGNDLANLCAAFWTPEQRGEDQREERILRRYFATVQAHGVSQYAWEDLLTDYQHGLIYWLLVPVQDAADGARRDYWWPKMQCLVAAFQQRGCAARLGLEATW